MDTLNIHGIIQELSSKQKLERDKALDKFLSQLNTCERNSFSYFLIEFISVIQKPNETWECYHGVLQAINIILSHNDFTVTDDHHLKGIRDAASTLLLHSEVRIRLEAGKVLGSLCTIDNCYTYTLLKPKILQLIQSNLERDLDGGSTPCSENDCSNDTELLEFSNTKPLERRQSSSAAQIFHDTAGWRNLETSMKCLESLIKGCGHKFLPFIDKELLELLCTTFFHPNRFVRETGFTVCSALVSCGIAGDDVPLQGNPIMLFGDQISEQLAKGLADNWSQVRLAASVATRTFLLEVPIALRQKFFPVLLPRICLNRYYVAEGVRLYSQETWRQVTGGEGRLLVEKYIDQVVPYYIESTEADNHAVREAACECISELALKIPSCSVRPHVYSLLTALKICFNDDSWPVRDAACTACGNFLLCFPEECSEEIENLFPLFYNNLQDNIPSVRQGASAALRNVVQTYRHLALPLVMQWITEALADVENQPSECQKYSKMESGLSTYGVIKRQRDNDLDLHSDQQMYSCGSLAPKMGRGGCSDCRFRRPTEKWERADGAIYLVGELATLKDIAQDVARVLPLVASATKHKHYTSHFALFESVCKILPTVAKGLGKSLFKPKLFLFFDAIFYSLESENALCSAAASQCLDALAKFLGPNILRGRIEEFNQSYLKALDTIIGRTF